MRWQGYLVASIVGAFCLHIIIFIDGHSHSASDTFYGVFPFIVPSLLALDWIASKTSDPTHSDSANL